MKTALDLPLLERRAEGLRLATPRLWLRRIVEADRAALREHEEDRGIMQWIRDPEPQAASDERIDRMIETYQAGEGRWLALAIAERNDPHERLRGIVCVRLTGIAEETMELGYRLHGDVQRRGYAFEACSALFDLLFGEVGLRKVSAMCVVDNEPSWRLMEKLGMQREGTLRQVRRLGGEWRDEYLYGLLRSEWRGRLQAAATVG